MDDTLFFKIASTSVGSGSLVWVATWLMKRISRAERQLRDEMRDNNRRCEDRNDLLYEELTKLRDSHLAVIRDNTVALNRAAKAMERCAELGSGHHPVAKDDR